MRILVAPDKFKDSLGAAEVAEQIAAGLRGGLPNAEIIRFPMADGGEGTARVICSAAGGEWHTCDVHDPMGNVVEARYCTIEHGAIAVMEMSEASGLWRVPAAGRDPVAASSFGTGELLLAAGGRGAREIIIGLGGSATNDGGFGMGRALGWRFLAADGSELTGAVSDLLRLARMIRPNDWRQPRIVVAADVRNPLLGRNGATRVYGKQKGGTPAQCDLLERALSHFADVVAAEVQTDFRDAAGAGAAGGLGFGLMSFCAASIRPGFDVVAERVNLEAAVRNTDVVITGEGRLDAQTLAGKTPAGVARLARKLGKIVYAVVGEADDLQDSLFDGILVLRAGGMTADAAIENAPQLLREAGRRLATMLR